MTEDLLILEKKLIELHPAIDSEYLIKKITNEAARIEKQLPEKLTRIEFFEHISPIVDSIDCSHTSIFPRKQKLFESKGYFPIKLMEIDNKIIVSQNYETDSFTIEKGTIIKSVNKQSIENIITNLTLFHGGSDERNYDIERTLSVFKFHERYKLFYGGFDSLEIEIQSIDSDLNSVLHINSTKKKNVSTAKNIIELEINKERGVGIITIKSFLGYDPYQFKYGSLLRKVFKKIKKEGLKHIIIDLRDNTGGAFWNTKRLLKYMLQEGFKISKEASMKKSAYKKLWEYRIGFLPFKKTKTDKHISLKKFEKTIKPFKKFNYNGDVVLLINSNSLSATTVFGSIIKSKERGKLIGTKAGGGYFQTYGGHFKFLKLKNSGISVRIPLMTFKQAVNEEKQEKGSNLRPDIEIPLTYSSFLKGRDLQLEKGFELFKM